MDDNQIEKEAEELAEELEDLFGELMPLYDTECCICGKKCKTHFKPAKDNPQACLSCDCKVLWHES